MFLYCIAYWVRVFRYLLILDSQAPYSEKAVIRSTQNCYLDSRIQYNHDDTFTVEKQIKEAGLIYQNDTKNFKSFY